MVTSFFSSLQNGIIYRHRLLTQFLPPVHNYIILYYWPSLAIIGHIQFCESSCIDMAFLRQ